MAIGPSTTTSPYLTGLQPSVRFTSIVTVGDDMANLAGGDEDGPFVGIPDGMGAFDNGDGTFTLLVNHELRPDRGAIRDHGSVGAFVDRLIIDKASLAVVAADDLVKTVQLWNDASDSYFVATTAFNRFCSGDLAEATAFFNAASGLGSSARIYLTGEEAGSEGRAFAMVASGTSAGVAYELPFLGNLSFENIVANPYAQNKTIVALTDDAGGGQVYIYVGDKQASGSEVAKAGLAGGQLYGIKVAGIVDETAATPVTGNFQLALIADAANATGAQIEAQSDALGVTGFLRPEDFAWDPDRPNVAYVATTASFSEPTRLYKLTFADITNPAAGGTVEMVIDGSLYGAHMFDNISVENGKVVIQEDPGNNAYVARVWEYDVASGSVAAIAQFDPARFSGAGAITLDEESSGVIDVSDLLGNAGSRAYLVDAQIHKATDPATTVEMGQIAVMYIDQPVQAGTNASDNLEGNGSAETFRGGNGNDVVRAWGGDDFVYGDNGNDRLFGNTGADTLSGDRGDDSLDGGFGNDLLLGGQGADRLTGGGDNDTLTGGQGGDLFIFDNRGETGDDRITDFGGSDRLLTNVALTTVNGQVDVSDGLALYGSSDVTFGSQVTALKALGTVTIDGVNYFAYGLAGGGEAASGFASLHAANADMLIV